MLRKKNIKFGEFVSSVVKNKKNGQVSYTIRGKALKKYGLTPEEVLTMKFPLKSKPKRRLV